MSVHVKRGGTWAEITSELWRKSPSVAWERIKAVYVRRSAAWQPVYGGIPENLIVFADSTPMAATFKLLDGSSGEINLTAGRHLRGSSADNGDIGADSHATGSGSSTLATFDWGHPGGIGAGGALYLTGNPHYHNLASHTHGSVDHQPPYITAKPYRCGMSISLPTCIMLYYEGSSAPTGWEVVSTFAGSATNGRYVKTSSTPGTLGGSSSAHTHGNTNPSTSPVSAYYASAGDHPGNNEEGHDCTHAATGTANPVHIDLLPIKPSSTVWSIPSGAVGFFVGGTVPPGWTQYSAAQNALIKLNTTAANTTPSGSDTHTDTSNAFTSGSAGTATYFEFFGGYDHLDWYNGHQHTVNAHTHGTANQSIPLSRRLLICKKD